MRKLRLGEPQFFPDLSNPSRDFERLDFPQGAYQAPARRRMPLFHILGERHLKPLQLRRNSPKFAFVRPVQIRLFVLRVDVQHVNEICTNLEVVHGPQTTTLALARTCPAGFPHTARARNDRMSIGSRSYTFLQGSYFEIG